MDHSREAEEETCRVHSYSEQKQVFCKQLEIALETDYPVVIHKEKQKKDYADIAAFSKKGFKSFTP